AWPEDVERRDRGDDLLVRCQDAGIASTMEVDDPFASPDGHGDVTTGNDAIDRVGPSRFRGPDPETRRGDGHRGPGGRRPGRDFGRGWNDRTRGLRRARPRRAGQDHEGGAASPRPDTAQR